MRSLFSNRYNKDRIIFYERYEAIRRQHPSLPMYERPVEPTQLEVHEFYSRRRYRSYRELAKQTREQRENESWLNSERIPITVRRIIEERYDREIMPLYNSETAQHVFSHNARPKRRGRRPAATTEAKIAADFALQVGAYNHKNMINRKELEENQNASTEDVENEKSNAKDDDQKET
ncbi:uncharacterized protein LOC111519072 [Drosophila willistoni]|uniref:uncharacterized protein LOC111519072 n=1 Tax=Drosophila willistoni TaxID=7260 RepID=UPI00017D8288|nr:uncharacterized protein LOC111519072 [Drosophila willistoni]